MGKLQWYSTSFWILEKNRDGNQKRKKYLLDEGYRCFIIFEFSKHKH